ncbi:hypothetical protein [Thermococcus sp.]|uniref:hypothetical protein n=1 Tax=Thermococcus sp. TaxID=35749 RepID=UPI0026104591|nr:hypothetical protein [Thermococcus sp.]
MPRRKYQRRTAGPGRPRKYGEDLKKFQAPTPESTYNRLYALKERLGVPFSELLTWLVDLAEGKTDKMELKAKVKHQEDYIKQLEREKASLLETLEKERQARERAEKEAEAWKQKYYELKGERSAHTYNEGKLLRALAEHAREGISWADLCAEVLDLRDEKKMKRLMQLAFEVKTTKKNTYATRFYPKRTAPEFKGWVLVRPEKSDGPVLLIDYELYREDTLKAAKGLLVGEAVAKTVPQVQTLKSGKTAEQYLSAVLEIAYAEYARLIEQRRGKQAKEFVETEVSRRLEKALERVDPADRRRAVLAVIEEHESAWNEAFVSNLRRVAMRALTKKLEVKADV